MRAKSWRWLFAAAVTAGLLGSSLGCQPASTGTAPKTTQPDNKDKQVTPPKPDVG